MIFSEKFSSENCASEDFWHWVQLNRSALRKVVAQRNLFYQVVLKQVREFHGKALVTSLSSPQVTMAAASSRWCCSSGFPCSSAAPVLHYELHTPLCVYPTSLRSITIGLFTALSYIGEVVAPLDIDYALYKLSNQDTAFFAMGFVTLDGEKQIHNILY